MIELWSGNDERSLNHISTSKCTNREMLKHGKLYQSGTTSKLEILTIDNISNSL